ncbi:MAG: MFS transporter [Acidobacteriota bacterium]
MGEEQLKELRETAASRQTKLPATAIVIGLVSFFSDVSTEIAYPLLPLFISTILGAPPSVLGLIEGVAEGTASMITGLSGWISDRFKSRKWLAIFGYGTTVLAKPLVALAVGWPLVLSGRFIDRFGKGVRSAPKDALLADVATPATRGRIFGFERMMDSAGAVLGPAFALLLFYTLGFHIRTVLLLTVTPAIAAFLLFFLVPEKHSVTSTPRQFSIAGLSREFWIFLAINTVFNIGNSSNTFLLLKASDTGMDVTRTLFCYMLYNAVYSLGSYPAGVVSDRLGRKNVLILGFLLFSLAYFGFAIVQVSSWIWVLFTIYGFYPALTDGVSKALAVDTTSTELRATAIGIFSAALGFSRLLASLIGGLLWEYWGSAATFYYGAICALLAVILFITIFPKLHRTS